MLSIAVNLWTRNLVIRQRVEDFQLGIESDQKQLNLTKPRCDAQGYEYKHDYTIIDSPRAVVFLVSNNKQKIMRFNEIYKFSDGTDLPRDNSLASVEVLRRDKRSKSENKGKVPTEMELVLEQTQEGSSHEDSGYKQEEGIDFEESFALVARLEAKSCDELEAKQNVQKVKEHLIAEEIEKLVEGKKNVKNAEVDSSTHRKNDNQNDPGTRLEPRSNKESLKVEINAEVQRENTTEEEEESAKDDYKLRRTEKEMSTPCRPSIVCLRDQDDPHDDAHHEGENSTKRQKTSKHGTYIFRESSYGQVNESKPGPSTSGNSGPEKIVMSLHKFPAVIFLDDDIKERTSRWVDKCVKKFNPYARYSIKHWKNPHAKIFYIKKQKEPEKPKDFITEIIARRANDSIVSVTESDYKNLNKNDIDDMYLLIISDKANLTAPTITFLGIEKYKVFSIISEPVYVIICKNKKKEKRVMRHPKIHKFSDATLKRVLEGLKSYNNNVKHGAKSNVLLNNICKVFNGKIVKGDTTLRSIVGQDGSGRLGAGVVIRLSATAGQGGTGAGSPGGLGGCGYLREYVTVVVGMDNMDKGTKVMKDKVSQKHVCEEEVPLNNNIVKQSGDLVQMPSKVVERGMDEHVPDEIDGAKCEQVPNRVVNKECKCGLPLMTLIYWTSENPTRRLVFDLTNISNTRPPMLDRTDFASWQQRIRLYYRGKENGVSILKSIDEGPYQMGTIREPLAKDTEGAPQLGPERPRVYSDLSPKEKDRFVNNMLPEWDRFVTAVKLNKGLRDSNYDQLYAYLKQHKTHAKENKMILERFSQHTVDPLALMSNVSNPQRYLPSSSTSSSTQVPQLLADNPHLDSSISSTENLIENLTNTLALLTQSYKTFLPQTNNQLRTSSNARNQATVQVLHL
nr:hypothetical protein [Tanacetum cinerariifolium]